MKGKPSSNSPSEPPSAIVPYHDWRRIEPAPEGFVPDTPVSVVVPLDETPEPVLARTLAGLERQDYPKSLFEVVVVDDGSSPPPLPAGFALDLRVVRPERRGSGPGPARNAGVRAAAHAVVLFHDGDLLVEADWIARHMGWHRAYAEVVTMGAPGRVEADDLAPGDLRGRVGPLTELFGPRPTAPPLHAAYLAETENLTARTADPFRVLVGSDFGIRKEFYRAIGGYDESFRHRESADRALAWRAEARGGLLVPLPGRASWRQGRRNETPTGRSRERRLDRGRLAHRIPHPGFRESQPGRGYAAPLLVVTVSVAGAPAAQVVQAVSNLLADPETDLVVRLEKVPPEGVGREVLENEFGADPRVFVAPDSSALEQFPDAALHLRMPATVFRQGLAQRLRREIGDAVHAEAEIPDGGALRITRGWALHRAERTGRPPGDFGETKRIPARALQRERAAASAAGGAGRPKAPAALLRRWAAAARDRLNRRRQERAFEDLVRRFAPPPPETAAANPPAPIGPPKVPGNDWRRIEPPLAGFVPTEAVSVVISCHEPPGIVLERTLAGLERQTYPRSLFEVLVVDDGSDPPIELPPGVPFACRLLRRDRQGGAAAARNTGARAAAHDLLLFLDQDMLVEAGWMAAHARWLHAVPEVVTAGIRRHVGVDDLDAAAIRDRPSSLRELFADRPQDLPRAAAYLARTNGLTRPGADDLFRGYLSADFGIRKDFYREIGGYDEAFRRLGYEDRVFAWRAFAAGGLLAPLFGEVAWHQGRSGEGRAAKARSRRINVPLAAHRIPHPWIRKRAPGRSFLVPRTVATVEAGSAPVEQVIRSVANLLADRDFDLVVRLETGSLDEGRREELESEFGPDPRVFVAPERPATEQFPAAAFHLRLPAAVFGSRLARRLRRVLGDAVRAEGEAPDGGAVSITRGWALRRAERIGGEPGDFGEVKRIPGRALRLERPGAPTAFPEGTEPVT